MNVYVASSWRCGRQALVVSVLRAEGHTVYDFREPAPGEHGFAWSDIDAAWQSWTAEQFCAALEHPLAVDGFRRDRDALRQADACVMVQPCGRSAALELGWCVGAGKLSVVLLAEGQEPELMLRLAHRICLTIDEVVEALRG